MPVAPKIHSRASSRGQLGQGSKLKSILGSMNYPLLLVVIALVGYGLLVLWTATIGSTKYSFSHQLVGVVIGVVVMIVLWRLDYRKISSLVYPLLIITIVLIILPLLPIIGDSVNGANSWVVIAGQRVQPAELAKITDILFLAALISKYKGRIDSGTEYLKCFGLMMIPVVSIMLQPDLGTGMVLFVIGMAALFAGGANRRWLVVTVIAVIVMIVLALIADSALDAALGNDVFIKDYQKDRLLVFLDPDIDPDGVSYNLKQSQIAIGSGGLFGKGIGNASQSGLGFLPEAPTDFVFCVLAEQFGFFGSLLLMLIYAGLLLLVLRVAFNAFDLYGTLIISGLLGMWIFQILENIGMTCGLMPITGIPLPFVSYGTSFMLVNFIALGLVFSIWAHRDPTGSNSLRS